MRHYLSDNKRFTSISAMRPILLQIMVKTYLKALLFVIPTNANADGDIIVRQNYDTVFQKHATVDSGHSTWR